MGLQRFTDLEVYKIAEDIAMQIFRLTLTFPKEEKYSLTDQIRRSSRSIAVNVAEGWGKRHYEQQFKRHLVDALGSLDETRSWILFSEKCEYLSEENQKKIWIQLEELGAKLYRLHQNWKS